MHLLFIFFTVSVAGRDSTLFDDFLKRLFTESSLENVLFKTTILVSHESWATISYKKDPYGDVYNFEIQGSSMTDMTYCLSKYIRTTGEGFSWNDLDKKSFPLPTDQGCPKPWIFRVQVGPFLLVLQKRCV